MISIIELTFFILGMLFIEIVIPIISNVQEFLSTLFKMINYRLGEKIANSGAIITKINNNVESSGSKVNSIGFVYNPENEYEEEDEDNE